MRKILITGASGCIGHYVTEALATDPDAELILFVRNPQKLRLDPRWRSEVTVVPGDMREINRHADLLRTVNVAILAATEWGGPDAREINVNRTLELLHLLDPAVCTQVLYFSTASVLDRANRPLPEAATFGTWYIRSKYEALLRLGEAPVADRTTILAPSLVFATEGDKPHSFFSIDVPVFMKYVVGLARFFSLDGSFHFIHARDVAQVVRHLVQHPDLGGGLRTMVLGQEAVTFDQMAGEVIAAQGKRTYLRLPLPLSALSRIVPLFQRHILVEDRQWGAFCLRYRHFTHASVINPSTFGLPTYCSTLVRALQIAGFLGGRFAREVAGQPTQP